MLSMQDAVQAAFRHFQALYSGAEVRDPLLEEIEPGPDGSWYDVVIGFNTVETVPLTGLQAAVQGLSGLEQAKKLMRRYKRFRIDAADGRLVLMQMATS